MNRAVAWTLTVTVALLFALLPLSLVVSASPTPNPDWRYQEPPDVIPLELHGIVGMADKIFETFGPLFPKYFVMEYYTYAGGYSHIGIFAENIWIEEIIPPPSPNTYTFTYKMRFEGAVAYRIEDRAPNMVRIRDYSNVFVNQQRGYGAIYTNGIASNINVNNMPGANSEWVYQTRWYYYDLKYQQAKREDAPVVIVKDLDKVIGTLREIQDGDDEASQAADDLGDESGRIGLEVDDLGGSLSSAGDGMTGDLAALGLSGKMNAVIGATELVRRILTAIIRAFDYDLTAVLLLPCFIGVVFLVFRIPAEMSRAGRLGDEVSDRRAGKAREKKSRENPIGFKPRKEG